MGLRGPVPLPTSIKQQRGNTGHRPYPPREPKPRAATPRCPLHVRQNRLAYVGWRQLCTLLRRLRVLSEVDGPMIEKLALTWARLRQLEQEINDKGLGIFIQVYQPKGEGKSKQGPITQTSAIYTIYRSELDFFFRAMREFGLGGPASRPRIQTLEDEEQGDALERKLCG